MDNVRVILEAVNENQLELAQRTVDSEVRKNPQSDVYLSLKVFVASRRNDRNQALDTAERAVNVCSKKTLEMFLIPVLSHYNAKDLLSTAFVRINRQHPNDYEICEAWLESSLALGNLSSAQKALMAMQRNSKKPRSVCYQACFIMALDNSNPVLFPALADRMIQKYLPAQTPQECYVVALVYKMKSPAKVAEYLSSSDVFSSFVSGSLELQLLLLDALRDTEKWDELVEYATKQLERIDSFNYWQALNTSAVKLNKPEVALSMIAKFSSSNAMLATVDLHNKLGDKKEFETAILNYWTTLGAKASTYKYLKPFIDRDMIALLEPRSDSLGMKINHAKFKTMIGEPLSTEALLSLYEEHVSEAPAEKSDYFIGTDALLMVAKKLIRSNERYSRIQAATLLEHALSVDPHQFYVRLLLARIYQSLGTLKLANNHFTALSIRNIQMTTLGHLLSTRVGSVAPDLARTVFPKLTDAYRKAPSGGIFTLASLFEGKFTQFPGIFDLEQKLRLSLDRRLLVLEQAKAARTTRGLINYGDIDEIPEPVSQLVDFRDFEVTLFDDGDAAALPAIEVGPLQSQEYANIQKIKELSFNSKKLYAEAKLGDLAAESSELTQIEKWNVHSVEKMILNGKNATVEAPPEYDNSKELDWELFHWCYTVLETAKCARSFKCSLAFDPVKLIQDLASTYSRQLNVWESEVNDSVRAAKLLGDSSKCVRLIKQEHMDKLKQLLESAK